MKLVRLVIVEDSATFVRGLGEVLADEPDFEVVGTATNADTAEQVVASHAPDVALVDLRLPANTTSNERHESHGLKLLATLRKRLPALRLLVLTSLNDEHILLAAVNAGANGFLSKDEPSDRIVAAIRQVLAEQTALSAEQLDLVDAARHDAPLSAREREILMLLADGLRTKEIADRLVIAEGTVKKHIEHILNSLNVSSRLEAVAKARRLGVL